MSHRTLGFDEHALAYVIRDRQYAPRAFLTTDHPVVIQGATPLEAAARHLRSRRHASDHEADMRRLDERPTRAPDGSGLEYRLLSEKRQGDMTTLTFQLTQSGLPVAQAGVAVHLKDEPGRSGCYRVIGTQISGHAPPAAAVPPARAAAATAPVTEEILAQRLGLTDYDTPYDPASLRVLQRGLAVHLHDSRRRHRVPAEPVTIDGQDYASAALPLPEVASEIADGHHYVVEMVYFEIALKDHAPMPWRALIDVETHSVLQLEPLAANVSAMVFTEDPMTTHGGPPANAGNDELNPRRAAVTLAGLAASNPQRLTGEHVTILDFSSPPNPPPALPAGQAFEFDARTDDFAAVNAYFHCDRFFRLVSGLGFARDSYFAGTNFPIRVDARGTLKSMDGPFGGGNIVQAQCKMTVVDEQNPIGGIDYCLFCVAEKNTVPHIGNANDWRMVLHELGGHGILFNHVGSPYLGFAHSAGDSLAAILNDPDTAAPDPGRTFPWTQITDRRHDRTVADGWGWGGPQQANDDMYMLNAEQILSSTHFRLYKALGGASEHDADIRHCAARITTYLILRAVQTLTPATNPKHAADWMASLIVADAADWTSEGLAGGAYGKVIYWAFQQQGLFDGAPPAVDVYIDDGRHGDYKYQADHTACPAIWNRRAADGVEAHEAPVPGVANFAYVKVGNLGTAAAKAVNVQALQNRAGDRRLFPDDWVAMNTPARDVADLAAGAHDVVVGPFEWVPQEGDNAILMSVTANGDTSNLAKFGPGRSIPDWRLVPHDNNIGLRDV